MLYIVGTPIGNMGDISRRAIDVLSSVQYILCEDTRVSNKLLSNLGIHAKLLVYNDYSAKKMISKIGEDLRTMDYALISDAGMPCISDPGYKLVQYCIENNIKYTVIPGASAVIAALVLSGMPSDRFTFVGFADEKKFQEIASINSTIIMFEAPTRICQTLSSISQYFQHRKIAIVREITKIFEESIRGTADELINICKIKKMQGEIVIVIEPPTHKIENTLSEYDEIITTLSKKFPINEISIMLSKLTKISKNAIYNYIKLLNLHS